MKTLLLSSVVGLACSGMAVGADLQSGLQIGDMAGYFEVKDVTGPAAGKSLCYRCRCGNRPVVNIFTRSLSDEVAGLVKTVDKQIDERSSDRKKSEQLTGFVVLLTDDPDTAETDLKAFAEKHGIKNLPLTYFDGVAGPASYNVAQEAEVTVNLWRKRSAKANHAFATDKLNKDGVAAVIADLPKILE